MLDWLGPIGGIILIDLVLSGDNALVIGAAASSLPKRWRLSAIMLGGSGAILLRITFAIAATLLLQLPLLQAVGAFILLFIAIRLLIERSKKEPAQAEDALDSTKKQGYQKFFPALLTILVADLTMSLDNVLAVGALASGNLPILVIGLLLSIALLLVGSAIIAELVGRLPWLLDIACFVLAWTAANMLLDDIRLGPVFDQFPWTQYAIPAASVLIVLIADLYLWKQARKSIF